MLDWLHLAHVEPELVGLTAIVVLGVGAQWLAARLKLPSILVLLIVGFIAGPVTGWVDPDALFGDALFPIVSLSVAVILYEGGLTLRLDELPHVGDVMGRLITLGALASWTVGALAARYVVGMSWPMAVLLGAILIVTGPTVIAPLLRQIRPEGDVGTILKWEGILIDPVGALLAVLTFEAIIQGQFSQAPELVLVGVLKTLAIGVGFSAVGAGVFILLLRRYWIPDYLQNGVSLLIVATTFTLSNAFVPESGLLTVTLLGLALANQHWVPVQHIVEFKENLQVLLIGTLFILLAARLQPSDLADIGWRAAAFLAILIFVARPLGVFAATAGSRLNLKERFFLNCMAPRGIVAAAVASIFAFELTDSATAYPGAEKLVPLTFVVIVGTVSFYGLLAGPIARRLGLAEANPQGVLIVGAHPVGQALGTAILDQGFRVLLVDNNWRNVSSARMNGLDAHYGNAASEQMVEDINLAGIGRAMAVTPNDEANSLAALQFMDEFDRAGVFQLAPHRARGEERPSGRPHMGGRILFDEHLTHSRLREALASGAMRATPITEQFDRQAFNETYGEAAIPLFLVTADQRLIIYTADEQPVPRPGQTLISLVQEDALPEDSDAASDKAPAAPA